MDDEYPTRGQEQRDLLLGPSSDFSRQRRWIRDRERETVRVSEHLWILGQCEVVAEEDRFAGNRSHIYRAIEGD